MGTPENTNNLFIEFESILTRFFKHNEVTDFTERFARTVEPEDLSKKYKSEDDGLRLVTESFFSANKRMVADRLITHAERILEKYQYMLFQYEFAKLLGHQGEFNQAMELLTQVRNETDKIDAYDALKAHTYLELGNVLSQQALWKECFQHIKNAKQLFEKLDDNDGLGMCEYTMGSIYLEQGDIDASHVRFENCLAYFAKKISPLIAAQIENNLGILKYIEANYGESLEHYNKALNGFIKLNETQKEASVRQNIGMVFLKLDMHKEAIIELDRAIVISYANRYLQILMLAYMHKALAYTKVEKYDLAISFADKSMEICYQLNDKLSVADLYKIKGIICREIDVYDLAEEYFLTSLRINRELNNELNYAETSFELGLLYKVMGNGEDNILYFKDALNYYKKINSKLNIAKIGIILAENKV